MTPESLQAAQATKRAKRWRLFFWLLLIFSIGGMVQYFADDGGTLPFEEHIAYLKIEGVISENTTLIKTLADIEKNKKVKAVFIHINSPGGTVAGAEAIYNELRLIAEKKPVLAMMGEMATSGGYIVALGADHILAYQTSLTGSIGVLFSWLQLSEMMEKLGVKAHDVKRGELKADPNPYTEPSKEALSAMEGLIEDAYNWFVALVMERRDMEKPYAEKLADGRLYTGRQAVLLGLIDEIGSQREARLWLADKHGLKKDLKLVTYNDKKETGLLSLLLEGDTGKFMKTIFGTGATMHRYSPNGLLSLWQGR